MKKILTAWYITIIGFLGIFSTTISKNPVLPLFVKGLGAPDTLLGLIAAASPFAGIVFSFPVGFIADRIGKRKLLIISALIFVTAPLMYLLVKNPLYLIPIRFFHGMATAIMGPVASAIIIGAFEKNKGEKLGLYSSATLVGRTLAPLLGGFLISIFAGKYGVLFNFRIVYLTAFLLSLPVLFFSILLPKEPENLSSVKNISLKDMVLTLKKFLRSPEANSTATIDMATYFIYGVLEAYLPIFLLQNGVPADKIALLFSLQVISIALTKPFFGKLADRIDKRVQILCGITILTITTILIPSAQSYIFLILDILIFGLGMSLSTVATSTYIAEKVDNTELASSLGLLSALMDVGQSLGPFLTGFVVATYSYQTGFYFSSAVSFFAGLYFCLRTFRNS